MKDENESSFIEATSLKSTKKNRSIKCDQNFKESIQMER